MVLQDICPTIIHNYFWRMFGVCHRNKRIPMSKTYDQRSFTLVPGKYSAFVCRFNKLISTYFRDGIVGVRWRLRGFKLCVQPSLTLVSGNCSAFTAPTSDFRHIFGTSSSVFVGDWCLKHIVCPTIIHACFRQMFGVCRSNKRILRYFRDSIVRVRWRLLLRCKT